MPDPASQTLRLTTAGACLAVAVAVALAPLVSPATDARAVGPAVGLGLGGAALAAIGLIGWAPGLAWGAGALGAGYGVSLIGRGGTFDGGAVLVAPALLLVTELGYWSLDARVPGSAAVRARRMGLVTGGVVLALVGAATVAVGMELPPMTGLALSAAGIAAVVGAAALALLLARRRTVASYTSPR
jgi:hypothetical protein